MRSLLVAGVVVACFASQLSAQIFYEPVQYQHGGQNVYYYGGGGDSLVHGYARSARNVAGTWGRVNGFDFVSANIDTHREVTGEPDRVFSDALGLRNARIYGYTANDARNDAYAAAPTYFRKGDLLRDAVRCEDGTWSVPAIAPRAAAGVRIYDITPARVVPSNRAMPRPLMIIPKDRLVEPTTRPAATKMADAR